MIYNFDEIIDRRGTFSVKYDLCKAVFGRADVLPMWVADMDFRTPDFIRDAVIARAKGDVYGYTFRDDGYYQAVADWITRRHGWKVDREWISYTPGVVAAINMAVMGLTSVGDGIIIQTPVYPPFIHSVTSHGRRLITNTLKDSDHGYEMDFDLLEKQAEDAKMLILSNPHNPVGRCWTRDELQRLGEICLKNNLLVISDEIHCDLVLPGFKHIPFASLSPEFEKISITAHAASKTFNIAGMATSSIIIPNDELREKYVGFVHDTEIDLGNVLGKEATRAAMLHGEPWLAQLLTYLKDNADFAVDFIRREMPKVRVHKPEATYLLWLDFSGYGLSDEELNRRMVYEIGLGLNPGHEFGREGENHLRMNLACPRSVLKTALEKMKRCNKIIS